MSVSTGELRIENGHVLHPSGVVLEGAVNIADGRVVGVEPAGMLASQAEGEVVDARGGLVLPGFRDGHIHPYHWAHRHLECNLEGVTNEADALAAIAQFSAAHPDRKWVTGGGWVLSTFGGRLPTRELLDSVVGDRPAYLPYTDGHGAWVNSAALRVAGIDDRTPDPAKGRIERDAQGRATGMLEEAAMYLVADRIPLHSDTEIDGAFDVAYQRMLSWGLVGWQDAMVVRAGTSRANNFAGYQRAVSKGQMRAHVVGALLWDPKRGLDQIDELLAAREDSLSSRPYFEAGAVKIFQDGVIENFTASMLHPYLDACGRETPNSGESIIDPDELKEVTAELSRHNFQVHFHALGDRAVREALDAVEYSLQHVGDRDLRHTIAHIQVVDPEDIPRFATLGVVANAQELWARHEPEMDVLTSPFLGENRRRMQYPFGALLSAGAHISGGSDWPVSTANPLEIIHTAVNRTAVGATGTDSLPFGGEHSLALISAINSHTREGAYLNHDDERSGIIAPGMAADLAILDRDIFECPQSEIGQATVAYTILEGEVVFGGDQ